MVPFWMVPVAFVAGGVVTFFTRIWWEKRIAAAKAEVQTGVQVAVGMAKDTVNKL